MQSIMYVKKIIFVCLFALCICSSFSTRDRSQQKIYTQFTQLDTTSLVETLSFYTLYPQTEEGKRAKEYAFTLLTKTSQQNISKELFDQSIEGILTLLIGDLKAPISDETYACINQCSNILSNRMLKGFQINTIHDIQEIDDNEIELSKALFLSQNISHENQKKYCARLDLMALQVLARLSETATVQDKIHEINKVLFFEMNIRFPAHSLVNQHIDAFSFLPHIFETRRGVCLGVATLYLCIAQRIHLALEAITPPGHIYIRYHNQHTTMNIETTARGIHIDDREYLGISHKQFHPRSLKEVIGMYFFNESSKYLKNKEWKKAEELLLQAHTFMPKDHATYVFLAIVAFLQDNSIAMKNYLYAAEKNPNLDVLFEDFLAQDVKNGAISKEGLLFLFCRDEKCTHKEKIAELNTLHTLCHENRDSYTLWTQLAQYATQEHLFDIALDACTTLTAKNIQDISIYFMLAHMYYLRMQYSQALKSIKIAENLAKDFKFMPKALIDFKNELSTKTLLNK